MPQGLNNNANSGGVTANYPLGYCWRPKACNCPKTSNPIEPALGNKVQTETDYSPGGSLSLQFVRNYNYLGSIKWHCWQGLVAHV